MQAVTTWRSIISGRNSRCVCLRSSVQSLALSSLGTLTRRPECNVNDPHSGRNVHTHRTVRQTWHILGRTHRQIHRQPYNSKTPVCGCRSTFISRYSSVVAVYRSENILILQTGIQCVLTHSNIFQSFPPFHVAAMSLPNRRFTNSSRR